MPRSSTPKVWKKTNRSENFRKTVQEDNGIQPEASTSQSLHTHGKDSISASAKKLSNLEEKYSELNTREFGNEVVDLNILNDVLKKECVVKYVIKEGSV
jgi:hypothetical protein